MANTYYVSFVKMVDNRHRLSTETYDNVTGHFAFNRANDLINGVATDRRTGEKITNVISSWYNTSREVAETQAIKVAKDKLDRIAAKAEKAKPDAKPTETAPTKETKWIVSWIAKKQTHTVSFGMKDIAEQTADALRASGHKAIIKEEEVMKSFYFTFGDGEESRYFNTLKDAQAEAGRLSEGFHKIITGVYDTDGNEYLVF